MMLLAAKIDVRFFDLTDHGSWQAGLLFVATVLLTADLLSRFIDARVRRWLSRSFARASLATHIDHYNALTSAGTAPAQAVRPAARQSPHP
jgi:hypothetical protein